MIDQIIDLIKSKRFPLNTEKELQQEIHDIFIENNIDIKREYSLGDLGIIDFYHVPENIGIEIKIKGSKRDILNQCLRYCLCKDMKYFLLITNKHINLPIFINSVKCSIINLGNAWL